MTLSVSDDSPTEPASPATAAVTDTMSAMPSSPPHESTPSTSVLLSSSHTDAFVRRRPRLHTALRLSASSAASYATAAPHTSTTYNYSLLPPTLSLSASTLASPNLPNHSTTAHDTFTFTHLFPPLDPPRTVHRQLLRPLVDGCVEGGRGNVVVVCYGDDVKAKTNLLLGREAGPGIVVQAMGALLQAIKDRERGKAGNDKQPIKAQDEEKREAEDEQPPSESSGQAAVDSQRRRKHRLTLSALRLTHSTLTDLLSPATAVSLSAVSTAVSTVEVNGWTEHRVRQAEDCVRLLLRAEKHAAKAEAADSDGHVVYRVGVESRWRRDDGEESRGGRSGRDGYRYSSLTFVKLAAHGSPLSSALLSVSSTSSATLPFSPHWVNKDILALTRVLSCLLGPSTAPSSPSTPPISASVYHVPYRSSLLTCALSSALEQCGELVLVFGLHERTDGNDCAGWDDGREQWRFVEEFGGVIRGRRQKEEAAKPRRRWRGADAEDEKDSDDEADERVPTVLEHYQSECAKRAAAQNPLSPSRPSPSPRPASPPPPTRVAQPPPQPSRPATPPPVQLPSATAVKEKTEEKQQPPPPVDQSEVAAAAEAKRLKEEEAAAALKRRTEKEADNRAAILLARQQQQQRDLDRELRTLQPLLTALALPARKVSSQAQLAQLKADVDRSLRQRVCAGVSVWKWSKKRVGGEVKRRECVVRWDDEAEAVAWEGRKRWRQVTKTVRRSEVERLVVGGGVSGGVLDEWKARMRALADKDKQKASEAGGTGSELSEAERTELRRQFRAIDRWSISVVSGGRVLDVVCNSEDCHVVLLEGLKRLLGEAVAVEDKRPGNGGLKVRDVKV